MASKFKLKDKIQFFEELKFLYDYGFNVSDSYQVLRSKIAQKIKYSLKKGKSISDCLAELFFEKEIIFVLKAAEDANDLKKAAAQILSFYKKGEQIKRKLCKALAYPVLTIIFSIILLLIFKFVIFPNFLIVFNDNAIVERQTGYIYWVLGAMGIIIIGLVLFFLERKEEILKRITIFHEKFLIQFLYTLSIISGYSTNYYSYLYNYAQGHIYQDSINRIAYLLKKGSYLSVAFEKTGLISESDNMILLQAETTGNLSNTLNILANKIEERYFDKIERLLSLIEPGLIILVGFFVGYIAFKLLIPMMQLTEKFL